jgi:hypothetical protein
MRATRRISREGDKMVGPKPDLSIYYNAGSSTDCRLGRCFCSSRDRVLDLELWLLFRAETCKRGFSRLRILGANHHSSLISDTLLFGPWSLNQLASYYSSLF